MNGKTAVTFCAEWALAQEVKNDRFRTSRFQDFLCKAAYHKQFYGIVIFMNYNDHPPPHFHARYQEQEVSVEIDNGLVHGTMSRRALRMVFEWSELHHEELLRNWGLACERRPLEPITPLD